jgi:glycosyltransferase involved in cell wall biosynthesis
MPATEHQPTMRVSVVVCEHTMDRFDDLRDAAESVREQSHPETELVLVSDGNEAVCDAMDSEYGDADDVVVHCLSENVGLLAARNAGAEAASGDVVAFLDDDAVADEHWVAELVSVYDARDVPAVGGKMLPAWVAGKPRTLPSEFYWLVGVTHDGFADGPGEVRNTFGSNISFRRSVFLDLGGFDANIGGRQGTANLQGGETELCARMQAEYGHGVYYTPAAEVAHKVFAYRTSLRWLLDRAFWQGYSKRGMEVLVEESTGAESAFLGHLFRSSIPGRLRSVLADPSGTKLLQFVMVFVFTAAVGFGYAYGFLRWR